MLFEPIGTKMKFLNFLFSPHKTKTMKEERIFIPYTCEAKDRYSSLILCNLYIGAKGYCDRESFNFNEKKLIELEELVMSFQQPPYLCPVERIRGGFLVGKKDVTYNPDIG